MNAVVKLSILILLLTSCSAQYHARKAFEKGAVPETIIIPDLRIDTFYSIHTDTIKIKNELDSILLSAPGIPDTCVRLYQEHITPLVTKYIQEEKVITDTLSHEAILNNKDMKVVLGVKVYQEGNKIIIKSYIKDSEIYNSKIIVEDRSYLTKLQEIIALVLVVLLVLLFIKVKK